MTLEILFWTHSDWRISPGTSSNFVQVVWKAVIIPDTRTLTFLSFSVLPDKSNDWSFDSIICQFRYGWHTPHGLMGLTWPCAYYQYFEKGDIFFPTPLEGSWLDFIGGVRLGGERFEQNLIWRELWRQIDNGFLHYVSVRKADVGWFPGVTRVWAEVISWESKYFSFVKADA